MIDVRIHDMTTKLSGYIFKPRQDFDRWPEIPRTGDIILDANEFSYVVNEVVWLGPHSVSMQVKRKEST